MLFWNQMFIELPMVREAEMGLWNGKGDGGSLCGVHWRIDEGGRACGPGGTAAGLLLGAVGDGGATQRGADGGGDGAGAGFGAAPETVAFRRQFDVVG